MTRKQIMEKALELFPIKHKQNKKATGEYDSNLPRRKAYIQGASDVLKSLWKDAQGEDLPEVHREVIALVPCASGFKVVYAHRVNENEEINTCIDGESLTMHLLAYDKGGWNQPDVAYWLDFYTPKPKSETTEDEDNN